MATARKLAALAGLTVLAYALAVWPRLLHWGATGEEVRRSYPGADLVPGGERTATMAVTIDAPPSRVWPWLVQMGTDHAGWYSWDRLDNWGRSSAERIHPEWQEISLGDRLWGTPDGSQSWEVAALEPEWFLGLRMCTRARQTVGQTRAREGRGSPSRNCRAPAALRGLREAPRSARPTLQRVSLL